MERTLCSVRIKGKFLFVQQAWEGGFGFYAFPPGCLVLFGTVERSCTTLADGIVSALDIRQMFTAFVFFVFWLFLKPISKL
jgi:hypothetical protein